MDWKQLRLKYGCLDFAVSDTGYKILIARPNDPALAVSIALDALKTNDADRFQKLPGETGDYTIIGFKSKLDIGPYYLDETGRVSGALQPGDSFVSMKSDALPRSKGASRSN